MKFRFILVLLAIVASVFLPMAGTGIAHAQAEQPAAQDASNMIASFAEVEGGLVEETTAQLTYCQGSGELRIANQREALVSILNGTTRSFGPFSLTFKWVGYEGTTGVWGVAIAGQVPATSFYLSITEWVRGRILVSVTISCPPGNEPPTAPTPVPSYWNYVRVFVLDRETGQQIKDARVSLVQLNELTGEIIVVDKLSKLTGADPTKSAGSVEFTRVPEGEWWLRIEYPGKTTYFDMSVSDSLEHGSRVKRTVRLSNLPVPTTTPEPPSCPPAP
jgi:hypothetical protein